MKTLLRFLAALMLATGMMSAQNVSPALTLTITGLATTGSLTTGTISGGTTTLGVTTVSSITALATTGGFRGIGAGNVGPFLDLSTGTSVRDFKIGSGANTESVNGVSVTGKLYLFDVAASLILATWDSTGAFYNAGAATISGSFTASGSASITGPLNITNTTNTTGTTSGAFIAAGGGTFGKDIWGGANMVLNVGGNYYIKGNDAFTIFAQWATNTSGDFLIEPSSHVVKIGSSGTDTLSAGTVIVGSAGSAWKQIIGGTVTLSSGAATVTIASCTTTSIVTFTRRTASTSGTIGIDPGATYFSGSFSAAATATDNSAYDYILFVK